MNKIITPEKSIEIFNKEDIVLVTGSFDILHLGHFQFLEQAKSTEKDAKLIVVVLSDAQIRRRKGESRPVFKLDDRVKALSYLEVIDYIIAWDQDWEELRDFVREVKPNVLAVVDGDPGIDNKRKVIEEVGGRLEIVRKQNPYSTSHIFSKLSDL